MVKWDDETFSIVFADLKIKMDVFFAVSVAGEASRASVRKIPDKSLKELFFDQIKTNEGLLCNKKMSDLWEEIGRDDDSIIVCDGIGENE